MNSSETGKIKRRMKKVLSSKIMRDRQFAKYTRANEALKKAENELVSCAEETGFFGTKEFELGTVSVNEPVGKLDFKVDVPEGTKEADAKKIKKEKLEEIISKLHRKYGTIFTAITTKEKKTAISDEIKAGSKKGNLLLSLGFFISLVPSVSVKLKPREEEK